MSCEHNWLDIDEELKRLQLATNTLTGGDVVVLFMSFFKFLVRREINKKPELVELIKFIWQYGAHVSKDKRKPFSTDRFSISDWCFC